MPTIFSLFGFERNWVLKRLDNNEVIKGQFHAEGITENVKSNYSEEFALGRQTPLTQFVHGETETISFTGRLYAARAFLESVDEDIKKLKEWVRRDESLGRPPLLSFSMGDGHVQFEKCFIESLSGITYDRPTALGALRHVTFTVNLRQFTDFELPAFQLPGLGAIAGAVGLNTRFHTASRGDYYETLTEIEYRDPLLGDVIRRENPDKPNIQVGDVILLPSSGSVVGQRVTQQSVPLKTGFDRKDTPQRALRLDFLRTRNRSLTSFVLQG
ncbi:hypothetical protein LCGC14_1376670 [marine sediment metagenome]|uniref:Uncharacterized protein n=1 Tax=marine sediment metagenome TaxID=412755 RepID=A0A0F9K3Y5_9ZZZZ